MPTGYTAAIKDGITFKQYALSCARAFGALIEMRDKPSDAPIPEKLKASQYNAERAAAAACLRLAELEGMTAEQAKRAAANEWDEAETRRAVRLQEIADQRAKYEAMLAAARAWVAPTPDHEGMKKFMCEQIEQSIDWDCDTKYHDKPTERLTGAVWKARAVAAAHKDVAYHTKGQAEEDERTANRNAWIDALRNSL